MKKKGLILMPFFMGYNESLKNALIDRYNIEFVNNEEHWTHMHEKLSTSFLARGLRRLIPGFKKYELKRSANSYLNFYLNKIDQKQDAYDFILCINGHLLPDKLYSILKKNNPNANMFIYLWDDASNLFRIDHLKFFNFKYSFNLDDCKKLNCRYLPMFVQSPYLGHAKKDKYDIAIIGTAHPDRLEFAKRLYQKYKNEYKIFIYFYQPSGNTDFFSHKEPMKYQEYLKILRHTKVVMDIPFIKQKGPTTRFFDALLTHTKVITTNENIHCYPVYSNNICIVQRENPNIPASFLTQEYEENKCKALDAFEWQKKIIK